MNRQRLILFILVILFGIAILWSYTRGTAVIFSSLFLSMS